MGSICPNGTNTNWIDTSPHTSPYTPRHLDLRGVSSRLLLPRNSRDFNTVYSLYPKKLGFGHYGDVKKCRHNDTGVIRAVKIFNKERTGSHPLDETWFISQIEILSEISHPCFIRAHEYFEDRDRFYLIMDYHKGVDLLRRLRALRKFSEPYAMKVIRQILIGISYLHYIQVAHRDLKPENVMVDEDDCDGHIKIIDFDTIVRLNRNGRISGAYGTLYYMAPEVAQDDYNEKCDIWSIGMILFSLLTGTLPFAGMSDNYIKSNIQSIPINLNCPELLHISQKCRNFLKKLIEKDPKKRLSAEEALVHPWLASAGPDIHGISMTIESMRPCKIRSLTVKDFLVCNFSMIKDYQQLDKVFLELDNDRDGVISISDFKDFFLKLLPEAEAERKAEKLTIIFKDCSELFITYPEFLNSAINVKRMLDEKKISEFIKARAARSQRISESSTSEESGSFKEENDFDDWIIDAKEKLDQDITPKDFCNIMLNKLYAKT